MVFQYAICFRLHTVVMLDHHLPLVMRSAFQIKNNPFIYIIVIKTALLLVSSFSSRSLTAYPGGEALLPCRPFYIKLNNQR